MKGQSVGLLVQRLAVARYSVKALPLRRRIVGSVTVYAHHVVCKVK
jgi:hypothetical protein